MSAPAIRVCKLTSPGRPFQLLPRSVPTSQTTATQHDFGLTPPRNRSTPPASCLSPCPRPGATIRVRPHHMMTRLWGASVCSSLLGDMRYVNGYVEVECRGSCGIGALVAGAFHLLRLLVFGEKDFRSERFGVDLRELPHRIVTNLEDHLALKEFREHELGNGWVVDEPHYRPMEHLDV